MPHPLVNIRDPQRQPRSLADLEQAVRDIAAKRKGWIELCGVGDTMPSSLPGVLQLIVQLQCEALVHGTRALMPAERLAALVADGLRALTICIQALDDPNLPLLDAAASLDNLRLTVNLPVHSTNVDALEALIDRLAAARPTIDLWHHAPPHNRAEGDTLQPAAMLAAVERAWARARQHGLALRTPDCDLPWSPPSESSQPTRCPPPPLDGTLLALIRQGVPLQSPRHGVTLGVDELAPDEPLPPALRSVLKLTRTLADTGGLLAALGWPARDLPLCLGGQGASRGEARCATCPGGSACGGAAPAITQRQPLEPPRTTQPLPPGAAIHVVIPCFADGMLVHNGLPGLAASLQARGAEVTVHSAWHGPTQPNQAPWEPSPRPLPEDPTEARRHAEAGIKPFLRRMDLSGADAVVVPGWLWSDAIARHPTLPDDARLIVADLHLMQGIDIWKRRHLAPGQRSIEGGWWPSERVHVHSCFPGYARLYWYAGIPMEQVHWLPYPTWSAHVPANDPASDYIFAGGAHLRDHETLLAAARGLAPEVHPIQLYAPGRAGGSWPAHLQHMGRQPLPHFWAAIARSRFVVVPLTHDRDRAAGISVIAMARAAGRPIIASATPATLDHIRHGVDGLLVPPGQPDALRDAITRLDTDDALRMRMTEATHRAARTQDVASWAHIILNGAPLARNTPFGEGCFAPW